MESILGDDGFFRALLLAVILSGIPLGVSMCVGLIVSVLQAATQIQDQTLTFVPKVIAIGLVLFFVGPWMVNELVLYSSGVLENLPQLSRRMNI